MEDKDNSIFRQKSMDKISSPEQLNDFIQVARPSIWLIMAAVIFIILGAAIWACFGVVEINDANGAKEIHPIEFVIN